MIFPVLLVLCAIGCAFKAFISYNGDISREASVFQSPLQLSPARIVSVDLTDDIPTSGRTLNVLSIVPQDWSESTIAQQLMQMRTEPTPIVSHYISSLKQRFIIGQDDRTALVRIKFMRRQLDAMKLFKEMKGIYDDFDVMELEKEKKIKMLKLETQALDRKANTQGSLEELQARRDEMQLQLEMAELEQKIAAIRNPPKPPEAPPQPSPEQKRADEKAACETRIETLKLEKQKALAIEDTQERILKVNALDDALQREMERWARLI